MMRDPMRVFWVVRHAMGVAMLLFPARRRLRQVEAENADLRRFVRLADGCAQAVVEGCDSLTNVR